MGIQHHCCCFASPQQQTTKEWQKEGARIEGSVSEEDLGSLINA